MTVNVWFKDAAGNVSGSVADSIILLGWSGTVQFGASARDSVRGLTTDSDGNIYVVGSTLGAFSNYINIGLWDLFVAKYSSSGVQQ